MKRKTRHIIRDVCIVILLFLGMSELILRLLDPFGINRYFGDLATHFRYLQNDNNLYILPDGTYHYSNWTATIEQGSRHTDTYESTCKIAFMGDSVTFGLGVNDNEVWVSHLALQYPEIEIRNYGLPGYNSSDILERMSRIDADGYLYLIISNDAEIKQVQPQSQRFMLSLSRYLLFILVNPQVGASDIDQFISDIAAMPENTLMIGFSNDVLAETADAILIEPYTHQISLGDPHASAAGNIEIYQQIQPHFENFIDYVCL